MMTNTNPSPPAATSSAAAAATATTTTVAIRRTSLPKSLLCDICEFRDGHLGLRLQQCTICHVAVHKECYGDQRKEQWWAQLDFVCCACRAVGHYIPVSKAHYGNGTRVLIQQIDRPTRCDLCSHQDGIHAMHPLYDNHGPRGRQLWRCDPEPRLLWVHSLCAFYLANKNGFVYGCTPDGSYDGDVEDDDDDDDDGDGDGDGNESDNSELVFTAGEDMEPGAEESIHHFVYCLKKEGKPHNAWTKAIEQYQSELKCYICGESDKPRHVLRIPLQCTANNPDEFEEFQKTHVEMGDHDFCTTAMHIGCARWGPNPNHMKRVFFFPGKATETKARLIEDPVAEIYCDAHALDIQKYREEMKKAKLANKQEQQRLLKHRRPSMERENPPPALSRQTSTGSKTTTMDSKPLMMKPSPSISKRIVSSSPSTRKGLTSSSSLSTGSMLGSVVFPSLAQKRPSATNNKMVKLSTLSRSTTMNKRTTIKGKSQKSPASVNKQPPDQQQQQQLQQQRPQQGRKLTRRQLLANLDKNEATAVTAMERPLLKKHRKEIESKKSVLKESHFEKVTKDVIQKVLEALDRDEKETRSAFKGRKKFWKRELSEVSGEKFDALWRKVGQATQKAVDDYKKEKEATRAASMADNRAKTAGSPPEREESKTLAVPRRSSATSDGKKSTKMAKDTNESTTRSVGTVDLTECDDDTDIDKDPLPSAAIVTKEGRIIHTQKSNENSDLDSSPRNTQSSGINRAESDDASAEDLPYDGRWARLVIGPEYRGDEFAFDEWDSIEVI